MTTNTSCVYVCVFVVPTRHQYIIVCICCAHMISIYYCVHLLCTYDISTLLCAFVVHTWHQYIIVCICCAHMTSVYYCVHLLCTHDISILLCAFVVHTWHRNIIVCICCAHITSEYYFVHLLCTRDISILLCAFVVHTWHQYIIVCICCALVTSVYYCILAFGWFPFLWILCDEVREHTLSSIFIGVSETSGHKNQTPEKPKIKNTARAFLRSLLNAPYILNLAVRSCSTVVSAYAGLSITAPCNFRPDGPAFWFPVCSVSLGAVGVPAACSEPQDWQATYWTYLSSCPCTTGSNFNWIYLWKHHFGFQS
jgi:hypothetical protein